MANVKYLQLTRYHILRYKDTRKIGFLWNDGVTYLLLAIVIYSATWIEAIRIISNDYYYGIYVSKVQFKQRSLEDYSISTFGVYTFQDYKSIFNPLLFGESKETSNISSSEVDNRFLTTMKLDISNSRWISSYSTLFLEMIPILNQSFSIILAFILKMVKEDTRIANIPNGGKLVVPIAIFIFIMTMSLFVYYSLATDIINKFCWSMKSALRDPNHITCGKVLYALRPILREHYISYDTALELFFNGAIVTVAMWSMAFTLMFVRFILGVDFELVLVSIECFKYPSSDIEVSPDISRGSLIDSPGLLSAKISEESSVPSFRKIKFR